MLARLSRRRLGPGRRSPRYSPSVIPTGTSHATTEMLRSATSCKMPLFCMGVIRTHYATKARP